MQPGGRWHESAIAYKMRPTRRSARCAVAAPPLRANRKRAVRNGGPPRAVESARQARAAPNPIQTIPIKSECAAAHLQPSPSARAWRLFRPISAAIAGSARFRRRRRRRRRRQWRWHRRVGMCRSGGGRRARVRAEQPGHAVVGGGGGSVAPVACSAATHATGAHANAHMRTRTCDRRTCDHCGSGDLYRLQTAVNR